MSQHLTIESLPLCRSVLEKKRDRLREREEGVGTRKGRKEGCWRGRVKEPRLSYLQTLWYAYLPYRCCSFVYTVLSQTAHFTRGPPNILFKILSKMECLVTKPSCSAVQVFISIILRMNTFILSFEESTLLLCIVTNEIVKCLFADGQQTAKQ